MRTGRGRRVWVLVALAALALGVLVGAPFIGIQPIGVGAALRGGGRAAEIFWKLRVPRVCVAFLAGAGLAVSGMAFQSVFRNPLATPFTLGVSSGASLGAAVYVQAGFAFSLLGISGISVFAFLGALLAIGVVYGLSRLREGFSTSTMLLAGVAVSLFFSSLILFFQYMSDFTQSFRILHWLMGGLEAVGFASTLNMLPFVLVGCAVLMLLTRELDLLMTGDDIAVSRGVDVKRVKKAIFFATSMMVGGVVASCGPIGFVGMMAPHICRLLIGSNHRFLMPATLLFGGSFLVLCDTLARTLIAPAEIPVGVVTALLGGPFFLWLLLSNSFGWGGSQET